MYLYYVNHRIEKVARRQNRGTEEREGRRKRREVTRLSPPAGLAPARSPVGASAAGLRVRTFERNGWLRSDSSVDGDFATVVLSDTVDIVGNTTAFFAVIEPRGGTLV